MRHRRWVVVLAIASGWAVGARANWNDTSTGIDLNKLPRFPLVNLRAGYLGATEIARFDGFTARYIAPEYFRLDVRLNGAGKDGRKWEVHLPGLDELWRGDLDGNGTQDM